MNKNNKIIKDVKEVSEEEYKIKKVVTKGNKDE